MNKLFKNAVDSLQLGIEDYQANDPKRALSAVRNFYAGTLLLAKEVLVRAAPNADPEEILGAKYKPVTDEAGGVYYEAVGQSTIDFNQVAERFNDFGLKIDHAALKDLNRIRNDIEHRFTNAPHKAVREAIAKAFTVVVDLFRLADEDPRESLGETTWQVMLDVRSFYESELQRCRASFDKVDWKSNALTEAPKLCPQCKSHLVQQVDPSNIEHQSANANCRACGEDIDAQELVEASLEEHFAAESYSAIKDGGEEVLFMCPECSVEAYVIYIDENGCAWCEETLGECMICQEALTPNTVDADNSNLCSYHGHVLSKDD